MTTWIFEPGHTEIDFRARHMMVTWVTGLGEPRGDDAGGCGLTGGPRTVRSPPDGAR